jgi:hypothetical protein
MLHIENLTVHMGSGPTALSRAFIEALLRGPEVNTDAEPTSKPPAIGEYWIGMGGIYAGIARGRDGEADYHLILSTEAPTTDFKWQAALDHAKTIESDGHKDFTAPTRFESALLYANLQDKLDTDYWHWTSTQYGENTAWIQLFSHGSPHSSSKTSERRCRFCRRMLIG